MPDPSKCLTLGGSHDAHGGERATVGAGNERTAGVAKLGEDAVRLIENWIVGVVTVLSAGVIVVTLLAHHDVAAPSDPSSQATIDAGMIRH